MDETPRPSKSQRKRAMHMLQDIGTQLVDLDAERLIEIGLPEALYEAVIEAQRIHDFEGRRRQLQYIGKLMRTVDPAPIQGRLERWRGKAGAHTALQHLAERWREQLLDDDDDAFALFAAEFSAHSARADLQRLRALVASVKRDQAAGRAPKNYRELFRAIRIIVDIAGDAS